MPSSTLHRLLYLSRAQIDPCGPEPRRILEVATERNAALDVTGVLCFSGDHFAQVLEGPPEAVDELMTSIRADSRHKVLREWPSRHVEGGRWFPGWSMAYAYDERLEATIAALADDPEADLPLDELAATLFVDLDRYQAHAP
jgi:hypothetical protein